MTCRKDTIYECADGTDATHQTKWGIDGEGVPQNYKTAVKWYPLATEQAYARAQYNLGVMYSYGEGVLQDYVRAHMWFNIAASSGESENASGNRDKIAGLMTPADVSKAQDLAQECVSKNYKGC